MWLLTSFNVLTTCLLTALDELTFCSERLSGHLNVLAVAWSVGSMRPPPPSKKLSTSTPEYERTFHRLWQWWPLRRSIWRR